MQNNAFLVSFFEQKRFQNAKHNVVKRVVSVSCSFECFVVISFCLIRFLSVFPPFSLRAIYFRVFCVFRGYLIHFYSFTFGDPVRRWCARRRG